MVHAVVCDYGGDRASRRCGNDRSGEGGRGRFNGWRATCRLEVRQLEKRRSESMRIDNEVNRLVGGWVREEQRGRGQGARCCRVQLLIPMAVRVLH
eukprot:1166914-Pleurochrysis_carterae.AAC.1